jgi:hypothetical protein
MPPVESPDPEHHRWPHDDVLHALWAEPRLLLAGEHPEHSPEGIDERLALVADAGFVTTVDLASRGSPDSGFEAVWLDGLDASCRYLLR